MFSHNTGFLCTIVNVAFVSKAVINKGRKAQPQGNSEAKVHDAEV